MPTDVTFTRVRFENVEALPRFSVRLGEFNVLVGPSNSGRSTVISAFRVLETALRTASARIPVLLNGLRGSAQRDYTVPADEIPVTLQNAQSNYESVDALIEFTLSNRNKLQLHFPPGGGCQLFYDVVGGSRSFSRIADFRSQFPVTATAIPVLGPLEDTEPRIAEAHVMRNLATPRAARNFRTYWWCRKEEFPDFKESLEKTWPGVKILAPEWTPETNTISMFVRYNQKLWIGFLQRSVAYLPS